MNPVRYRYYKFLERKTIISHTVTIGRLRSVALTVEIFLSGTIKNLKSEFEHDVIYN